MAKNSEVRAGRPAKKSSPAATKITGAEAAPKRPAATLNEAGGRRRTTATPVRDAERTRESILRHATLEFSQRGFDGARVDRIAARCRLSKNTLYYHFGSKDGLISAALENMYQQLRSRQENQALSADDPKQALCQIIEQTFRAFIEQPAIIPLLNEENLHKARHLRNPKWLKNLYDPLLDSLAKVLRSGVASGVFCKSIDPVLVYITISSLSYHFISNSHTLQIALGRELSSEAARERWVSHIRDVVLTYCQSSSPVADGHVAHGPWRDRVTSPTGALGE